MLVLTEELVDANLSRLRRRPKPIKGALAAAMKCRQQPGLSDVDCEFHEGIAVLRGLVPSYYMKQIAQERAKQIQGVEQVINQLVVKPLS